MEANPQTLVSSVTLSGFCRDTTRLRLSLMCGRRMDEPIAVVPVASSLEAHGDWMAVTIAQSKQFRLILRLTYRDDDIVPLAQPIYGLDATLTVSQINDFVRELSNQIMGSTKRVMELKSDHAKSSFTLITHREDFPFFAPNPTVTHFEDRWLLKTDNSIIQCAVSLEFLEASLMQAVQLPAFPDSQRNGDVEFLFA